MPDLFTLTTDRVQLSWAGPPVAADGGTLMVEPLAGPARLAVGTAEVRVATRHTEALRLEEATDYPVLLRSRTDAPVSLHHRDAVLVGGLTASEEGRVHHGVIRFGGFVGASRFVVLVGGRPEVAFTVTVVPAKVTAADGEAMRREIESALDGLALRFVGPTVLDASGASVPPSRPVWLTRLRAAVPALEAALAVVALHPRPELRRSVSLARTDRITRPDATVRRAARRGGREAVGNVLPLRLSAAPPRATLDTPAHRWLRARVERATRQLARVRAEEGRLPPSPRRASALDELDVLSGRLERLLRCAPLADVAGPTPTTRPLLLTHTPGYADAAVALRHLDAGLALRSGPEEVVPRDLGALYEVWCYLTLARLIAAHLGVPVPSEGWLRADAHGVRLRLRRGHRHALVFGGTRATARLVYEPRFPSGPGLLTQRPDFLLSIEEAGKVPRLFVLDAKYRRDDSAGYRHRHGAAGPPEDALGVLHRYRDAIVTAGPGGAERPVEAAVALYPLRADEAFEESRLWSSIATIGVGAIPLLPGNTRYLERWLGSVLVG